MADPTIVLVHGAFADASGFRGLYDELLGEDVTVVAPPNPLRGLSGGDGEYIKAVIKEIDGPVLQGRAALATGPDVWEIVAHGGVGCCGRTRSPVILLPTSPDARGPFIRSDEKIRNG